ncbi:hypothetical protein ACVWYG_000075 [Pedobacter sp. UYEF25]
MSAKAIDYKVILKRDGQTQQQRKPALLDPAKVLVDERTKADYYSFVQQVAKQVKFYEVDPVAGKLIKNGTWESFFEMPIEEIQKMAGQASLPAHLSLWNAFIELMDKPKTLMNNLSKRHLDFYYHEVLRLNNKPAKADQAHVFFELKKNTENTLLTAGAKLLAGKDDAKKEIIYQLQDAIIVNHSKVSQLKSIYANPNNGNAIFQAPIANSKDGLGAALDPANPKWSGFGNGNMPLAQVGFCLASAALKMKEGNRTITVYLSLRGLRAAAKNALLTSNLFNISITGEKGWIGPKLTSATITSADNLNYSLKFSCTIGKDEPAVIGYDGPTHSGNFETVNPILQVLLNNEKSDFGYRDLLQAELIDAMIEVEVKGIQSLGLENDFGTLNPKKPFLPFGPLAEENSNFYVLNDETFSKRLKSFSLDVNWKNIPSGNLKAYFTNYNNTNIDNAYFTASASFKDGFSWNKSYQSIKLFNDSNAQLQTTWGFENPDYAVLFPVYIFAKVYAPFYVNPGQSVAQTESVKMSFLVPGFSTVQQKANILKAKRASTFELYQPKLQLILNLYREIRKGQLQLTLNRSFLFKDYREKYTAEILRYSLNGGLLKVPAEPFAPEIQSISLNYKAITAKINFNRTSLNDYIDQEIEFFQYGAFGQAREHAYTRSRQTFLTNGSIKLLPQYTAEGELLIGLSDLKAQDTASILFQVVEGSANPEKSKINVEWAVLCDNYWKVLSQDDLVFDTTNGLLTSGIVKIIVPKEATTSNTLLPVDFLWVKASVKKDTDSVCNLIDVQANAAAVVFYDQGNDPSRLLKVLPANSISKLQLGLAQIKKITQPYASFGGAVAEEDASYYTRVSERLRHKERAIAIWDYERLILAHFSKIHKVKCINHANRDSFYAPGNTLIVVVPDLTNQNATDLFKPKVDKNTLEEVKVLLSNHASAWVNFDVVNPTYEAVKIAVALKLKKGYEFNYYQNVMNLKLQEFLSPWINNGNSDLYFGGKITKSMVIKFLEDLEYVDYLISLSLFKCSLNTMEFGPNVEVAEASNPASILVSYPTHSITTEAPKTSFTVMKSTKYLGQLLTKA